MLLNRNMLVVFRRVTMFDSMLCCRDFIVCLHHGWSGTIEMESWSTDQEFLQRVLPFIHTLLMRSHNHVNRQWSA